MWNGLSQIKPAFCVGHVCGWIGLQTRLFCTINWTQTSGRHPKVLHHWKEVRVWFFHGFHQQSVGPPLDGCWVTFHLCQSLGKISRTTSVVNTEFSIEQNLIFTIDFSSCANFVHKTKTVPRMRVRHISFTHLTQNVKTKTGPTEHPVHWSSPAWQSNRIQWRTSLIQWRMTFLIMFLLQHLMNLKQSNQSKTGSKQASKQQHRGHCHTPPILKRTVGDSCTQHEVEVEVKTQEKEWMTSPVAVATRNRHHTGSFAYGTPLFVNTNQ